MLQKISPGPQKELTSKLKIIYHKKKNYKKTTIKNNKKKKQKNKKPVGVRAVECLLKNAAEFQSR